MNTVQLVVYALLESQLGHVHLRGGVVQLGFVQSLVKRSGRNRVPLDAIKSGTFFEFFEVLFELTNLPVCLQPLLFLLLLDFLKLLSVIFHICNSI